MPTPYEFDKYVHALMVMDWYYYYSDDHHVWLSLLQGQAKEHQYYQEAFDAWTKCVYEGRNAPEAVEQRKAKILSIKARIASETINA